MIIKKLVGITSYGISIPSRIILGSKIEKAQRKSGVSKALGVVSKTVPDLDEDSATLAIQAAYQALERFIGDKQEINNLFIGSESHPYVVKPTGTVVKQALGLSEKMSLADLQFACKAGTQAMQISAAYVASGFSKYGLAIGSDTAQAAPGDVLEFTAGAGAGAYIIGGEDILAKLIATASIATDTPDFWRRPGQRYPQHAGRFSGKPAYFYHVVAVAKKIMNETRLRPSDFEYCVFHTPNSKFPKLVAKNLGFSSKQLAPSLLVEKIGNTYAGAVPISLSAVLDIAKAGDKVLVVSYGSGAGSDGFIFEVSKDLEVRRKKWTNNVLDQIKNTREIDYLEYLKLQKWV